jgi:glycosyltransferase involved in cell wall biosynthesis
MEDPKKIAFDESLPTVLFVLRDTGGCGFYRCLQPALHLRRSHLFNTITDVRDTTPEHILQADIVVFQNIGSPSSFEAFNFALASKKAVVVEVDDYLNGVSPHNPGSASWNPSTLYLHRATQQMQKAFAMTVSTPQLAREYFPYNERIHVLPNFLDKEKWDMPHTKNMDGMIRIGWSGGNAHLDDLKMIEKVIEKIVREYDGKVKFEMMGMVKQELKATFGHLGEFSETCPKCNYQGEFKVWNPENQDNYPIVLSSHGWDIALAPVVDTAFNNAKSDLKIKEYAACGYPVVASKVTPYEEAVADGARALLCKGFDEWYNSIKELIEDEDARRETIKGNKEWIATKWIDDNVTLYADTYKNILENFKSFNPS